MPSYVQIRGLHRRFHRHHTSQLSQNSLRLRTRSHIARTLPRSYRTTQFEEPATDSTKVLFEAQGRFFLNADRSWTNQKANSGWIQRALIRRLWFTRCRDRGANFSPMATSRSIFATNQPVCQQTNCRHNSFSLEEQCNKWVLFLRSRVAIRFSKLNSPWGKQIQPMNSWSYTERNL